MRFLGLLLIFLSFQTFAQELNCRVTVNYEGLSVNNREILAEFAGTVEAYMNSTSFTGQNWDGLKIDCALTIFFTSGNETGDYGAQVVVISTRPVRGSDKPTPMLTINDATWNFKYVRNQALYANQATFDPLTGFLDFYANIIIGFDWDTWDYLGGNPYFKKAFDIVSLANNSSYKKGWERSSASYSRWGLCEDLLNDKYRQFREAFYEYHVGGVDLIYFNRPLAQERIASLINLLAEMKSKSDINSVLIRQFFDAKSGEIIDFMRDYKDNSIFLKLKQVDPPNSAKYDQALI